MKTLSNFVLPKCWFTIVIMNSSEQWTLCMNVK